tara:strand:+ start:518 stop:925 length:408 start_codon:yes stop_codon:yes gene_type:complete
MSLSNDDIMKLKKIQLDLPKDNKFKGDVDKKKPYQNSSSTSSLNNENKDTSNTLFHKYIKASKDGNIPSHLIKEIKEIEEAELYLEELKQSNYQIHKSSNNYVNKFASFDLESQLYITFKDMLLEEMEEDAEGAS